MKKLMPLLLVLTIGLNMVAHAQAQTSTASSVSIEHLWARATLLGGRTGAVYVTIVNHGSTADRLIRASTPIAEKVRFHRETNDNGVMRIRELPAVDIAPGASVTFKPGAMGNHGISGM